MAEEVEKLAPQYCRPGEPAIANHQLIHHVVHNDMPCRRANLCTHLRRGARDLDPALRLRVGNLPEDSGSLSPSAIGDFTKTQIECGRWAGGPMSFQLSRPKNSRRGWQSSWRGDEFLPRVEAFCSTTGGQLLSFCCLEPPTGSRYSPFKNHICWKVPREDKDRFSNPHQILLLCRATTSIFDVDGAKKNQFFAHVLPDSMGAWPRSPRGGWRVPPECCRFSSRHQEGQRQHPFPPSVRSLWAKTWYGRRIAPPALSLRWVKLVPNFSKSSQFAATTRSMGSSSLEKRKNSAQPCAR